MHINQRYENEDFLIEGCIKLANELIQYYTKQYLDFPPFHPERIAETLLNIKVEENDISRSGCVSTYKEKKFIILNKKEPSNRKRFTCAHELAHILFYEKMLTTENIDVERLCDIFASNLLMPAKYLEKAFQDFELNFNFKTLEEIINSFKVSLISLIYRIKYLKLLKNSNNIILLFEDKVNKFTGQDKKLRVYKSILPVKSVFYIPENIGVDTLGLSVEKLRKLDVLESTPSITESLISQMIDIHTGKYKKKVITCNAIYKCYGYTEHKYILGLFDVRQ